VKDDSPTAEWTNLNVVKFDGYYGPYNKNKDLSNFTKQQKNLLDTKDRANNVFKGLNAAAYEAKVQKVFQRGLRNISPHAHILN